MNTKLIQNTIVKSVPDLPELVSSKHNRVFTKHFTNLPMYLNANYVALLNWLVYQSKVDGTVMYSSKLLRAYTKSVQEANKHYNGMQVKNKFSKKPNNLVVSITSVRHDFQKLIETGYLWPTRIKNKYMISPMLLYHNRAMKQSDYKIVCAEYRSIGKTDVNEKLRQLSDFVMCKVADGI